jgi:hypothetical protein
MGHGSSGVDIKVNQKSPELPEYLAGIISNDSEVLAFASSGLVEVANENEVVSRRILSLKPVCGCLSSTGTYCLGFGNGSLSEFDGDLNLLTSFFLPGDCYAHATGVIKVCASDTCHLASIGSDRKWNFWDGNGLLVSSFDFPASFVCTCMSDRFAWMGDLTSRVHVVRFSDIHKSTSFVLPAIANCMVPFFDGFGCLAALEDGSIAIISSQKVIAHFLFPGRITTALVPLIADLNTGLVAYLALDTKGELTLRILEDVISTIGNEISFLDGDANIVYVRNRRMCAISRKDLATRSLAHIPKMELPRHSICEFLAKSRDEAEL